MFLLLALFQVSAIVEDWRDSTVSRPCFVNGQYRFNLLYLILFPECRVFGKLRTIECCTKTKQTKTQLL